MSREFDIAISIGSNCRIAHQLRRCFPDRFQSSVFDWQVTPTATLLAYLERDFVGIYEPHDLAFNEAGVVRNTRFDTLHPHEFPKKIQSTSQILSNFLTARQRHNYLVEKTRALLRGSGGTLLLGLSDPTPPKDVDAISTAISTYGPKLKFSILPGIKDEAPDWKGTDALWSAYFARNFP